MVDTVMGNIIPGKDERGRFLPGHQYARGHGKHKGEIVELRRAYLSVATPEAMAQVTRRHLELILRDPPPKDIATLLAMWYDRVFGKPKEQLEIDVATTGFDPSNLSPQELDQLLLLTEKAALPTRSVQQPLEAAQQP
jgi:hypothetical protein